MFGIGMPELAVILVVGLIVLGPKRLPEVARALGKGLAEFRRVTGEVNKELDAARSLIEQEAREHDLARRKAEQARAKAAAQREATKQAAADPLAADGVGAARGAEVAGPPATSPTTAASDAPATGPTTAASGTPPDTRPVLPAGDAVPVGTVPSAPPGDEPGSKG